MSISTKMAPRKTCNKKATVAARQTAGDDTATTNNDQLAPTKWHHNFRSVKRIFDKDSHHPSMECLPNTLGCYRHVGPITRDLFSWFEKMTLRTRRWKTQHFANMDYG